MALLGLYPLIWYISASVLSTGWNVTGGAGAFVPISHIRVAGPSSRLSKAAPDPASISVASLEILHVP